jgi:plastocyanin
MTVAPGADVSYAHAVEVDRSHRAQHQDAGTHMSSCSVGNHRASGMKGKWRVG